MKPYRRVMCNTQKNYKAWDLESNCTLNQDNKDIESGIEVSGYGELSELADHVTTTSMNRNGHET